MPAESAPGQFGPDSFGARVQGSEGDKTAQAGRVVPPPTTRRHPVTGQFTARHPHDVFRDVHQDLAQRQAQESAQKLRDAHARRRGEDRRI